MKTKQNKRTTQQPSKSSKPARRPLPRDRDQIAQTPNGMYMEMAASGKISSRAIRVALQQSMSAIVQWQKMATPYALQCAQKMEHDLPVMNTALQLALQHEQLAKVQIIDVVR